MNVILSDRSEAKEVEGPAFPDASPATNPGCPIQDAASSRLEWETTTLNTEVILSDQQVEGPAFPDASPATNPGCPIQDAASSRLG